MKKYVYREPIYLIEDLHGRIIKLLGTTSLNMIEMLESGESLIEQAHFCIEIDCSCFKHFFKI